MESSAYRLLLAASSGLVGIDQRWVHALVDDPGRTLPDLLQFASEDRSEDRLALEGDLISIFRYLKKPEALPFLLNQVRADPSDIEDDLVEAIAQFGPAAVEPLLTFYQELEDPETWYETAFLLAGLGTRDVRILDLLLARLDKDLSEALFLLEVYGDPAAIPALEKRAALAGEDELAEIEDTIRDLREPRAAVQPAEFNLFELYPEQAGPDFEVLSREERMELLCSSSAGIRADAAASFFPEELEPEEYARLLDLARRDPDPNARARSWEALLEQAAQPELRREMLERLGSSETPPAEKAGLAVALSQQASLEMVQAAILHLVNDPATRAKALEAMWRSGDASFTAFGAKYLDDPDLEVRRGGIWVIGYLGAASDAPLLERFFEDEDLRIDALHNYAIAAPGETSRARMRPLLKKIADLARGLDEGEEEIVQAGLDIRLAKHGYKSVFSKEEAGAEEESPAAGAQAGRNDPCPCGSGKKYKKCCGS